MGYKEILRPKTLAEIEEGLSKLDPDVKLKQCAAAGYFSGVKEAISNGADINCSPGIGDAPLDAATLAGQYKISEFLLDCGAFVSDTSLGNAIFNRELFKKMLTCLDPNLCSCQGLKETIEIATDNGRLDVIMLIEERIKESRSLTKTEKLYLEKMMMKADDISHL
jgi:hypothetical protein